MVMAELASCSLLHPLTVLAVLLSESFGQMMHRVASNETASHETDSETESIALNRQLLLSADKGLVMHSSITHDVHFTLKYTT